MENQTEVIQAPRVAANTPSGVPNANLSRFHRFKEWVKRDSSFTDWCIAAFTLVLAATGIYQYFVIQGQLRVARQDERAWLQMQLLPNAPGGNTTAQITSGQPLTEPLRLTNTGKTPAKHVKGRIYASLVDAAVEAPLEYVDGGKQHPRTSIKTGILYPNQGFQVPATLVTDDGKAKLPTDAEVRAVTDSKMYLAIFRIVEYDDVFNIHHWSKFCLWHSLQGTFHAERCAQFNSADEN